MKRCPECHGELYELERHCSDYDGMRLDQYCADCHIRYSCSAAGLSIEVGREEQSEQIKRQLSNALHLMSPQQDAQEK